MQIANLGSILAPMLGARFFKRQGEIKSFEKLEVYTLSNV